jgi:MFS family permease
MDSTTDNNAPSKRSLQGLDGLNFFLADVRDGVGPFLSIYLKGSQHWAAGQIGIVMAVSSITAAICQIPAGLLVDAIRGKRGLIAVSGILVGLGCLSIALFPNFYLVIGAQILLGAASAIIPPGLAALTLGLIGRRQFPNRISRNEGFNHGGNFAAAILAGTIGQWLGYSWIFYFVCIFAVASAWIVSRIRPEEINNEAAREASSGEDSSGAGDAPKQGPLPFRDLLRRRELLIFLASVILFHFANAAMLPMAGQVLAKTHPGVDISSLSACVIAAQLVMVGVAAAVGWALRRGLGRKTIFLCALVILPIRGVLFSFTDSPVGVVAIQLLDGVAAGIFGVISIVIAADLMRGTGRFNLAQGLVAFATGLGATLSNLTAGFVVQAFGYPAGFLMLAVIAAGALIFFALFMPETSPKTRANVGTETVNVQPAPSESA